MCPQDKIQTFVTCIHTHTYIPHTFKKKLMCPQDQIQTFVSYIHTPYIPTYQQTCKFELISRHDKDRTLVTAFKPLTSSTGVEDTGVANLSLDAGSNLVWIVNCHLTGGPNPDKRLRQVFFFLSVRPFVCVLCVWIRRCHWHDERSCKAAFTVNLSLDRRSKSWQVTEILSVFYLSICLSICLSTCLPVCLSFYLSVYLSVCLSIYLSFYLSFYLSVYLSVCALRRV